MQPRRSPKFHLRGATDSSYEGNSGSDPSSRPTSPAPLLNIPRASSPLQQRSLGTAALGVDTKLAQNHREVHKEGKSSQHLPTDIGILDDEVYNRYLSWPVAAVRRLLVWSLRKETPYLAWHQKHLRTPLRDRYFVYTSLLGTHSFFLIFLPMAFWLGSKSFARGLVNVLAFGVYFSSAIKDWLCVPRPYSPPVTRLTIGTHHLEYGFPSTHSTNAVSIAFYVYLWVISARDRYEYAGVWGSYLWEIGLLAYVSSVVYGRIYTGMHSMVDCVAGTLFGLTISLVQWTVFEWQENALAREDWTAPLVIIPMGLLMVSVHPQPLDDCPCFEDAIAFVAVSMGVLTGRWAEKKAGLPPTDDGHLGKVNLGRSVRLLPSHWGKATDAFESALDSAVRPFNSLFQIDREAPTLLGRVAASVAIMVFGVTVIVLLRIVTKSLCRVVLPPIIRFAYETFGLVLPRRHYKPATEYNKLPAEDLRAVPSVIDLPSTLTPSAELGSDLKSPLSPRRSSAYLSPDGSLPPWSATSSAESSRAPSPNPLHNRDRIRIEHVLSNGTGKDGSGSPTTVDRIAEQLAEALSKKQKGRKEPHDDAKRYDAEVLTKVVVYSSIGFWASTLLPVVFLRLGWCIS